MKILSGNPNLPPQTGLPATAPSAPPTDASQPKDNVDLKPPGDPDPNKPDMDAAMKSIWNGFKLGALVGTGVGAAAGGTMALHPVTGALAGAGMGVGGLVGATGLVGAGACKLWAHQWKNNDLPGLWLTGIGSLVALPLAATGGWYGGLVGGALLGASGGTGAIIGGAIGVACVGAAAGGVIGAVASDGFKTLLAESKKDKQP